MPEQNPTDTAPPEDIPAAARPVHDFDAIYADSTPPWDIGRPQSAFLELARSGALRGAVLDVGCGTGEHALMAAEMGFHATGIDAAPTAIKMAQDKASSKGLEASFFVWDALEMASLETRFDTVLDCGLFHVFDDADRARFVESLAAVTRTDGRYFLLCFSDAQPGDWGPRRIRQEEIRSSFSTGWRIDSIEPATLEITISDEGALAWLATITRT
jgi:SAM-dependent methyltransferase